MPIILGFQPSNPLWQRPLPAQEEPVGEALCPSSAMLSSCENNCVGRACSQAVAGVKSPQRRGQKFGISVV
eukprot:6203709-Pleurochrysis_carterae.AAC.1